MKKKLILAAVAAVAITSGYLGYSTLTESKINTLAMANVEALSTSNEHTLTMACCSSPKYTGSWDVMTLDCSGCTYRLGYSGINDSRCP